MLTLVIIYCQLTFFSRIQGRVGGGGKAVGEEVADFILILSVKSYSHFLYIS